MGSPRDGGVTRSLARARRYGIAVLCAVALPATAAGAVDRAHAATAANPADAANRAVARATVPGQPGVPQGATPVFVEDFENRATALPVRLTNYTGAEGTAYTADQAWLQNCNGWVTAFSDPPAGNSSVAAQVADCAPAAGGPGTPGATAWNRVRQLAQALGVLDGAPTPAANHAVSAYTNGSVNNGDPGANKVEFETVDPIPVAANGRYLTFAVDAAETSCDTNHNHALLDFFLTDNGTVTPVSTESVNPCTRGTQVSTGYWAGTFSGDAPLLFTGTAVGLRMTNAQGSGNGNDHAFDNIRLLDVTPQLDKDFKPGGVEVGGSTTLTYTITNTDDLLAKEGWSFTDTLPDGLTLATPANATTDCPAGTLTAPDGGTEVTMTGGAINAGQASCTATVSVTSATAGSYSNGPSNITVSVGLNPPDTSVVVFVPEAEPAITLEKSAAQGAFSSSGQIITYIYRVTNTGNVTLNDVGVVDDLPGLSAITCPEPSLDPDESQDCTADYETTDEDVERGFIHNVAIADGTPPDTTTPVTSDPSDVTIPYRDPGPARPDIPAIGVKKLVKPVVYRRAGQVLRYRFRVTNVGEVTLTEVKVTDSLPGLSAITCPRQVLEPKQSQICTATYRVTERDMDRGVVRNRAVAHGRADDGTRVTSPPSRARARAHYPNVPVTG